jgi:hypothetical protein
MLMLTLWVQTEGGQQFIIHKVTSTISKELHTTVKVGHVSISFFNKFNLEKTLINDKKEDTLLYAGNLSLQITDWFFLKDTVEMSYIGLTDAIINLHRSDSIWNNQFIIDYFSPKPNISKKKSTIQLLFGKIALKNVKINLEDSLLGERLHVGVEQLDLKAKTSNISNKKIAIEYVEVKSPTFIKSNFIPLGNIGKLSEQNPTKPIKGLQWNTDNWDIQLQKITISNGLFAINANEKSPTPNVFDPEHMRFRAINAQLSDVQWKKDTLQAHVQLSTKERSGFTVNQLVTNFTFHPKGMFFQQLDLQTPESKIGNYFAMRYDDLGKDMVNFIQKTRLELTLQQSTIHSNDIAYFAPQLKNINKSIIASGKADGTVENFTANNMHVFYGDESSFKGDLTMKGLPDINNTRITVKQMALHTTISDITNMLPKNAKSALETVAALKYIDYNGSFEGTWRKFLLSGNTQTALGSVTSTIEWAFPENQLPRYDATLKTDNLDLGQLLNNPTLGKIAFSGNVKGVGFQASDNLELNGNVTSIFFNNYLYHNIALKGKLQNKSFTGEAIVKDPNCMGSFKGYVSFANPILPEFNLAASIENAFLKPLNFATAALGASGKFKLNIVGKTLDDIIGEATLFDVVIHKNNIPYAFDTTHFYAQRVDQKKQIEISNSDFSAIIAGEYKLTELSATINDFLSRYFPIYFKKGQQKLSPQTFSIAATLHTTENYLQLIDKKLAGFENATIKGFINTASHSLTFETYIPQAEYGKYTVEDFRLSGKGDLDSLHFLAQTGTLVVNDSLRFPAAAFSIDASNDETALNLQTSGDKTIKAANLSARIKNLSDGVKILFNPSSIVLNEQTWKLEENGELILSKSKIDASEIKLSNGNQEFKISTIPSEIGNSHDIVVTLSKVNLGDILPFVLKEPRIQGITSGELTIEDPLNKLKFYLNAQTEQTRFENDSIGITSINGFWDNATSKASFNLNSENPLYTFKIGGKLDLADSSNRTIDATFNVEEVKLSLLEKYIGVIFAKMDGTGSGNLRLLGKLSNPDLTGSVRIHNAGVLVDFTKVYYTLQDHDILFKPGLIDFGELEIKDQLGNTGKISGQLRHQFFSKMNYNFSASSRKILAINTTKANNNIFYGNALARINFNFSGPEDKMQLSVSGAPVDSSHITIANAGNSKQRGDVDYILWRQYGKDINADSLKKNAGSLAIDLNFSANPLLNMTVVLDATTGDSITANGDGNVKIVMGNNEAMVMNGRFNINKGEYNFNFQDIFHKPFTLESGSGSYISWTGDPFDAEINIHANYLAEKVRISSLFDDGNRNGVSTVNSDLLREISDVNVKCYLTGTLNNPIPAFEISLPANSTVKNNPTVDNKLKTINRDVNEVSKQATYLLVFKSFAPEAAIVTNNISGTLLNSTISGVINVILSSSVQNLFYKLFGSGVNVNFNYSRMGANTGDVSSDNALGNTSRENVSLQFVKSLVNNRLVLTFGSDFNFNAVGNASISNQNFLFLPDVNMEYKITPDGKLRASFFYRSSFDALSTSGRRDRTGGNISFRTEFDRLFKK